MKYIRMGIVSCAMFFGFNLGAAGQNHDMENTKTLNIDSLVPLENSTVGDSVVHVAYKTVDRKDLTGAISVLNPSKYLDKDYGTNPLEGTDAFIGGDNLWNLGTPLVLIDGVPDSIVDVISSEIAQITFLKGANAVVLYGSRAANGVVLVTTKRGKVGKREQSVRVNTGIDIPKSYPNFLGAAEYMTYYNQALQNDGLAPLYDDATIQNTAAHTDIYRYPDVNYFSSDYLRKLNNVYSANAQFTGGNENARFYAIAGFQDQKSLLNFGEGKNEDNTRLNVRGNIDLKLNNYISAYVNISTVFSSFTSPLGNYWGQADSLQPQRFAPLIPLNLVAGSIAQSVASGSSNIIDGRYLLGGTQQYLTSPIADVYAAGSNVFTSRQFQYTNGINVDLRNALKGLSFHAQMSIDYSNMYNESINNTYAVYSPTWISGGATDSISALTQYNKDSKTGIQNLSNSWSDKLIDFNVHFDYKNTFREKNNVSAILVADGLRRLRTGDFQYRTNANIGLQLSYNYDHKYYADLSGAVVNSSKYAAGERVAFSPTLSLGWLLNEENFLKNSNVVDRLKLTASAGIINTDLDIPPDSYYLYDAAYSSTAYFSWADGTYTNRATTASRGQNLNLTFAKRKEINFGLEGSLFKKKLDFVATAFYIRKEGIPVQAASLYPNYFVTGFPPTSFIPYTNFGANLYHGVDFQLRLHEKAGNVNLTFGVAGTYETTKVLKVDELYVDKYQNRSGKPIDAIFGLQSEGLFGDQNDINGHASQKFGMVQPGNIKYKDENGDGVIDGRDEVMIGRWGSPFTGGLNVTAQWKNFTLFVLGTGSFGGTGVRNNGYYWVSGSSKYSAVVRNSWTEATKNTATYPRLTTLNDNNDFQVSDFWTYSTDRFDISKVQLTYTFPDKMLKKSFVRGLNLYVSGNDLMTISKNRAIMELNIGSAPQVRFYNFGIKAEF